MALAFGPTPPASIDQTGLFRGENIMKRALVLLFVIAAFAAISYSQTATAAQPVSSASTTQDKRAVFRPTKDQIAQAQGLLKGRELYAGDISGKYNPETRAAIRDFQKANGLKSTGNLNRATLEKLGIELTESQVAIPVSQDSFAPTPARDQGTEKPNPPIFRATKEQITAAQRTLKTAGFYDGEETGKLDDATRAGLKKYQAANGIKVTGTLNQITLEKMGIELTERQKAAENR